MQHRPRPLAQRGLTLVEAAATLAIAALLVGLGTPDLRGAIDTRRLDGAATRLAADLQFARTEAVARNRPVRFGVQTGVEAGCWLIHTGAAASCTCAASGGAVCGAGSEPIKTVVLPLADGVALQSNVASILFDPVHGTSTPTGTLRVVGAGTREVRHIVNVLGRLRSCSPLRAVPGYAAC